MESDFIHWLRARLPEHPCLRLGPGDDAAILQLASTAGVVVTVDLLTEGVDFLLAATAPRRIGRKALAVNLSDLAAMAARPIAVVIALALPRHGGLELACELYEGMLPLAEQFDVAIAGGDTNSWNGPLVLSVTAIGQVEGSPLTRGGARPGDAIVVTGEFGGSIAGHHFDFTPRVHEALDLNSRYPLHAGMDVSDGLSLDLSRLVTESGCGALLDLSAVPIRQAAHEQAIRDGRSPIEHALADGEDFELILTMPDDAAQRLLHDSPTATKLSRIGTCIAEPGLWTIGEQGQPVPLAARGYEHQFE